MNQEDKVRRIPVPLKNLCKGCFFLCPSKAGTPNYCYLGHPDILETKDDFPCMELHQDLTVTSYIWKRID